MKPNEVQWGKNIEKKVISKYFRMNIVLIFLGGCQGGAGPISAAAMPGGDYFPTGGIVWQPPSFIWP